MENQSEKGASAESELAKNAAFWRLGGLPLAEGQKARLIDWAMRLNCGPFAVESDWIEPQAAAKRALELCQGESALPRPLAFLALARLRANYQRPNPPRIGRCSPSML